MARPISIGTINIFFISRVNFGLGQFGEENGRPIASQMKPARKPEAALCVLRELLRRLKTCFNSAERCYRATEKAKAFAAGANAFPNSPRCFDTPSRSTSQLYGLFTTTC